jgi:hypothetical protein
LQNINTSKVAQACCDGAAVRNIGANVKSHVNTTDKILLCSMNTTIT